MPDGTPENPMGTGGNVTPSAGNPPAWMAQLSDDLKGAEGLTKFANISDLGKSYLDLAGKSEGSVKVPGENASDEEKTSFYKALGRPDAPDGYQFARPNLPEGIQYDDAQEKSFRELAHAAGMTQAQAEAVYQYYHQSIIDSHGKYEKYVKQAQEAAQSELQKEWGTKYQGNVEIAKRAIRAFGDEATIKFLDDSRLGDNPMIIRLFQRIGAAMTEDQLISGSIEKGNARERTPAGTPMLDFPSMEK